MGVLQPGETVRPLPAHGRPLDDLTFESGGERLDVGAFMARRRTAGMLVLKDGAVVLERYAPGRGPERRWQSYSTAKSITSTLAGAALHDGAIGSLDDPCERYVPRLCGSAYEGVTIRNLLRMCSGAGWDEMTDPEGPDVQRLRRALESGRSGAILDLACELPRAHPQGTVFTYSTIESCVLGAVVSAATGRGLADYGTEKIWRPAGMEAKGYWAQETQGGLEIGGAGVVARLRDVARFGLLVMDDGVGIDGRRVLPPGWRDLAGQPDCAATGFGRLLPGSPAGYGYQWWVLPHGPTRVHRGAFAALGAYGQRIYVHPSQRVVFAIQSAWPQSQDVEAEIETSDLVTAAVRALQ